MPLTIDRAEITGLVLAGGRGSRMGGVDKGLQPWRGLPLAQQVRQRLQPQVGPLLINANRHLDIYRSWGLPVVTDGPQPEFAGPLAGFLAGLDACTTRYLLTAPCDCPLLPLDLADRLGQGLLAVQARIALPRAAGRLQPVFCLMDTALRDDLRDFVAAGGSKIDQWTARHPTAIVDFDDAHAFENINTQADLQRLERTDSP
ncbi:MAG: molybdenum cofactor guanylyltransferase MobA [Thiomonas sp.]|jgi:molybdopterin-guanine dinucleotide biosynthesis protein A